MPTILVSRPAIAYYHKTTGLASDGLVYVDGIRGTLSLTSGGLGQLPVNTFAIDFKEGITNTTNLQSVGIQLTAAVDSAFNPYNPISGNKFALEYLQPTVSAGQFGIIRREGWTVT